MNYETVIGLEVHLQLATHSKIFCSSSAAFGADPNTHIDPLTFGLPGALPVLNKQVVNYAIMLGLALNCEIRRFNRFARKHYFYPDLPKGYQISQFDEPICERGSVNITVDDVERAIGITRIHMEEDAGKNIHDGRTKSSLVDLNRAGVPLLEIVSEPDLRSPAEAAAYLKTIRQVARYLQISDGNMDEGSLRCDANISIRPEGEMKFGTRAEVKNINSFKFVERAISYEVARQLSVIKGGGEVVQETRLFDSATGTTHPMRSKEESAEYRYFPDPDLPPLVVEQAWVEEIKAQMPKLPNDLKKYFINELKLSDYDAGVLAAERENAEYFMKVFEVSGNAKASCNWITTELFGLLKKEGKDVESSPVSATSLGELISLIDNETISGKIAKQVFEESFYSGDEPKQIVEKQGLQQMSDEGDIRKIISTVLDNNEEQLAAFFNGKDKLKGFFVGQVMKETQGKAKPALVNELLDDELSKRKP